MMIHQKNKQTIWQFWQAMNNANNNANELTLLLQAHLAADVNWNGPHPINSFANADSAIAGFYRPLHHAFAHLRRDPSIFLSGRFAEKDWVSSTGHFEGVFANDWLGIPANGQPTSLRYGEFCAVQDGQITDVYLLLDVIDLLRQVGQRVLPMSNGSEDKWPRPQRENGILLGEQNTAESAISLRLVESMIGDLGKFDGKNLRSMRMEDTWHEHMHWYGPCGIGSAFSLSAYYPIHSRPFLHAFPDRKGGNHKARIAEGEFVASTGWPSIRATHLGDYLGTPASGKPITMRVMDFWWREGDKLSQNWVFIDLPNLFLQFDVDLLAHR
jgi:predicted ester cyclase